MEGQLGLAPAQQNAKLVHFANDMNEAA